MNLLLARLGLAVTLAGTLCAAATRSQDRQVLSMGTRLTLHLEGPSRAAAAAAATAALREVERIEQACSTWRPDSSWSALNAAGGAPVPLAPEWLDLLAAVREWARRTEGAFDPAIRPLMEAWAIRAGGRTPAPEALARAWAASGFALLVLDSQAGTARFSNPEAGLEEGGFLKGYALDQARRAAMGAGASAGLLDFGGQLLAWGRPRRVGIADPVRRRTSRYTLRLRQGSLSSSGCSERGRHILDPRTGAPCPAWGEVSVRAATGLEADLLSTALFVLGPAAGLRWATDQGVAALFLSNSGEAAMSPAFRALKPEALPRERP